MFSACSQPIKDRARTLSQAGWKFYVVNQTRGYCDPARKIITIPAWAARRTHDRYNVYYIAHELAHTDTFDIHGPKFMARFMDLCPPDLWKYEIEYKPRNAKAAGISEDTASNYVEKLGF